MKGQTGDSGHTTVTNAHDVHQKFLLFFLFDPTMHVCFPLYVKKFPSCTASLFCSRFMKAMTAFIRCTASKTESRSLRLFTRDAKLPVRSRSSVPPPSLGTVWLPSHTEDVFLFFTMS